MIDYPREILFTLLVIKWILLTQFAIKTLSRIFEIFARNEQDKNIETLLKKIVMELAKANRK